MGENRNGISTMMNNVPPVNKGDILDLKIESLGTKGDGLAKVKGFAIFVKQPVTTGKTYECKITTVIAKCAFAEIIREL